MKPDALENIYSGRAGGVFAALADTHVQSAEVETAPFSFSRDDGEFSVEIGDIVTMETVAKTGFNEDVGVISPHPLSQNLEMKTGKSTTATVDYDDQFSWDVSENNTFFCDFELANA